MKGGELTQHNPQVEAVQLLMALNREIYFSCPEISGWALDSRRFLTAPRAKRAERIDATIRRLRDDRLGPVHPSHPVKLASRVGTTLGIALILVVAGPVNPAQSKTTPKPGDPRPTLVFPQFVSGQPLHMVAYGDTRFTDPAVTGVTNPRVRKWLAERIGHRQPQAILLTGDTPFNGANQGTGGYFRVRRSPGAPRMLLSYQPPAIMK